MLNARAQYLLKTLVEQYIADGHPVGSRTLVDLSGLALSSASVRNVLADLETQGFITSPHKSAGRVPTVRGYRYFVDVLLSPSSVLTPDLQARLAAQLRLDDPRRAVTLAAQLLAELSHFAGVVTLPRRKSPIIRHIDFLRMGERRVLLILVAMDGSVQNRLLEVEHDHNPDTLNEAAHFLNVHYVGCTLDTMRKRLRAELRRLQSDFTSLMNAAIAAGERALAVDQEEKLVVSGVLNLLNIHDPLVELQHVRQLFEMFEQKTALLNLLEASQQAQGVRIFIGEEAGLLPLDEYSMVTAAYQIDGENVGTLGVIGPTRMAYARVIPMVDTTAKRLSKVLSLQ